MRPNIVFAFADDWGRYASAYRNQPGKAPSMNSSKLPTSIESPKRAPSSLTHTFPLQAALPAEARY